MDTVIIAHDKLAYELLETANKLLPQPIQAQAYSNQIQEIDAIVMDVLKKHSAKTDEPLFIFTDFKGGSCWQAAFRIKHEIPSATIISGVNIPMLISFGIYNEQLQAEALTNKITEDAIKSIQTF